MKKYLISLSFLLFVGCGTSSKGDIINGLNFVAINYTTSSYANIRLDDQTTESVQGANYIGSYTNSGEYCCIDINPNKKIMVQYTYIENGKEVNKVKEVNFLNNLEQRKNLILHILPNEFFLLETTDDVPQASEKILDDRLKELNIKRKPLDEPLTWRLRDE